VHQRSGRRELSNTVSAPVSRPFITFLSDYGLDDDFVGICHGVIARICPEASVIDIAHGVRRHDIRAGALMLRDALAYVPSGVHLAVVDPDVGAERRAVALRLADERLLVGPDNGLLWPAAEFGGGVVEAADIARSPFRLEPLSATFHGRDIFAPVAARLAAGTPLAQAGEPSDPDELVELKLPRARRDGSALVAHALHIDSFGNVSLDVGHDDLAGSGLKLGRPVELDLGEQGLHGATYVRTFADAGTGELLVYEDAHRRLAVAISHGDAAARLGIALDAELRITAG
jgi:S-adenosyl-L-methionine hydrolase (adenosine-forming)